MEQRKVEVQHRSVPVGTVGDWFVRVADAGGKTEILEFRTSGEAAKCADLIADTSFFLHSENYGR